MAVQDDVKVGDVPPDLEALMSERCELVWRPAPKCLPRDDPDPMDPDV